MANNEIDNLIITSPAFENEANIPAIYTCDGESINPPLMIAQMPEGTQSLAIILEDPDASKGTFYHWVVWNIPPSATIAENQMPGISGKNGAGKTGYVGPCPPSGSHRYYFNVFALDHYLELEPGADSKALEQAMEPHIIAKGSLMGRYQKQ